MLEPQSDDEFVEQVRRLSRTFIPYNQGPEAPPSKLRVLLNIILSPLYAIPGWIIYILLGLLIIIVMQLTIEAQISRALSSTVTHVFDKLSSHN